MSDRRRIQLIDTHCGGDVSRVVTEGVKSLPGVSVREQMEFLKVHGDGLRRLLLSHPYGSADMSVDLVVAPSAPEADFGCIIMESMGYPAFSGSNIICTAAALLDSNTVRRVEGGEQAVKLESPAGVSVVVAEIGDDHALSVSCEHPDSFILEHNRRVDVHGFGEIGYSIAYSGVFYVLVRASDFGLRFREEEKASFIDVAQCLVGALQGTTRLSHPLLGDMGSELFVHFMGNLKNVEPHGFESGSASFAQPAVLCHSTTGTGTCARMALMELEGAMKTGETLTTIAMNGSRFVGKITDRTQIGPFRGIRCAVTGAPQILSYSVVIVDLDRCSVPRSELLAVLA